MSFGGKARTKAEQLRFDAIKAGPCLACEQRGLRSTCPEIHHLLSGGRRIGHLATVGLCQWHHRAVIWHEGVTHEYFRRVYGPSLAEGSKPFRHEFGNDEFLLEMQNRILDERKADA